MSRKGITNRQMSTPTIFPLFFISLLAIGQPAAAKRDVPPLRYAEHLFNREYYQSSTLEYRRFLFYHPDTNLTDFARYRIAQGYYYQRDTEKAQQLFRAFTQNYPDSPLYLHAQLMLGKSYFDTEDYSTARIIFFQVIHANKDKRPAAHAQYLRSWCYIHERNWLKGIATFRDVRRFQPDTSLSLLSTQLADHTLAKIPLPFKSPKRAQWLSTLLPGSGQIYAGELRSGLISTVTNAAFFYLLADAIRDERYVDAVGISLVGFRFYWGNRSDAKQLAIEHNRKLEGDLIRQLKRKSGELEPIDIDLPEVGNPVARRRK